MTIDVNSTEADLILALYPMYIPGASSSVLPSGYAHFGIPLAIYPPTGLFMVIDPLTTFAISLAVGDSVVVWLNEKATSATKVIKPGEENDRILLDLPTGLLKNGINTLFYQVTRPSGNDEDSKPVLNVLFNNPAPTITITHPPSIGPGQPAVVTITIGNPRAYDSVTLTIGTWSKTFTNFELTKPITHTLTAAELKLIGDGTHPVFGTVVDQLSNSNVSVTTSIKITANPRVLNPPIIVQAEANNKVLDVVALKGANATIHALTWTGIVALQPCWMKVVSFKADGSAHDLQIWSGRPAQTSDSWIAQGKYPTPLLNSYLAVLGDGKSLTIQFWVSEDKSNNFATATRFADQVYSVKAAALEVPTLTNVIDANNKEVPEGSQTISLILKLKGTASKGLPVEIFDGSGPSAVSKGRVTSNATTGIWEHTINVPVGARRLYAQSRYHPKPVYSNVRLLKVIAAAPPLAIDTSLMRLDGVMVRSHYCPNFNGVDAIGNTAVRAATGGTPPYIYRSSDNTVVAVENGGKVTGMGNGSATITVTDSRNSTVTYGVAASNIYGLYVYHKRIAGTNWDYAAYTRVQSSLGYIGLTVALRAVMARCYRAPWFVWSAQYPNAWTGSSSTEAYNSPAATFFSAITHTDLDFGFGFHPLNPGMNAASAVSASESEAEIFYATMPV